ncbi:MAG TPA: S1 RNA-binding domain-containing protein [Bacilli bacterium]|nr:S1 RNA-binding domain-containing protein [Bacilli bacterium]
MISHNLGDIVKGLITEIAPYGAFVELDDGCKGLLHISEISSRFVSDINEILKLGQELQLKIISVDANNGYLRFSLKQMPPLPKIKPNRRVRVKLPADQINFEHLKEKLMPWIKQALDDNHEE